MRRWKTVACTVGAMTLVLAPAAGAMAAPGNGKAAKQESSTSHTVEQWECDETPDQPSLHPSGRDRHCEPGGSGTQGKARSEPDADGRGPDRNDRGTDKPGHDGGLYPQDQDGNNGCGNDHDFEDDNEGWCLGPDRERPGNAYGWHRQRSNDEDTRTGVGGADEVEGDDDGAETGESTPRPGVNPIELDLEGLGGSEEAAAGVGGTGSDEDVEVAGVTFGVGGADEAFGVGGVDGPLGVLASGETFGVGGAEPATDGGLLGVADTGVLARTGVGLGLLVALALAALAGGGTILRRARS
jgi:hypothetical protein